jgi:hypothetical protein
MQLYHVYILNPYILIYISGQRPCEKSVVYILGQRGYTFTELLDLIFVAWFLPGKAIRKNNICCMVSGRFTVTADYPRIMDKHLKYDNTIGRYYKKERNDHHLLHQIDSMLLFLKKYSCIL